MNIEKPKCPEFFTTDFTMSLVRYFGEDDSVIKYNWTWEDVIRQFPHLKEKIEKYFEEANEGNLSYAAFSLHEQSVSSRELAEKIIEKDKTGDSAWAA